MSSESQNIHFFTFIPEQSLDGCRPSDERWNDIYVVRYKSTCWEMRVLYKMLSFIWVDLGGGLQKAFCQEGVACRTQTLKRLYEKLSYVTNNTFLSLNTATFCTVIFCGSNQHISKRHWAIHLLWKWQLHL